MIFYNGVPVIWHGKKKDEYTEEEAKVREQIEGSQGIRQKYFGEGTAKKVKVLYPKGEYKIQHTGYEMPKIYPLYLTSSDGMWEYSKTKNFKRTSEERHMSIRHGKLFTEKDIEFIWFLTHKSSAINRVLFIEDLEDKATKEVEEMGADAALTFMLMNEYSPIFKNNKLIREIAEIFNVQGIKEMKENQTRVALYNAIKEGEHMKDSFCNFKTFDSYANGEAVRDIAHTVRIAITDKLVGYSVKDRAWFIMSGKEYSEKLMSIKAGEADKRDELLIQEVISNPNVQTRLFSAMGISMEETCEKLRDLSADALKRKLQDLTGTWKNIKKEELVKELCEELKIEYTPV